MDDYENLPSAFAFDNTSANYLPSPHFHHNASNNNNYGYGDDAEVCESLTSLKDELHNSIKIDLNPEPTLGVSNAGYGHDSDVCESITSLKDELQNVMKNSRSGSLNNALSSETSKGNKRSGSLQLPTHGSEASPKVPPRTLRSGSLNVPGYGVDSDVCLSITSLKDEVQNISINLSSTKSDLPPTVPGYGLDSEVCESITSLKDIQFHIPSTPGYGVDSEVCQSITSLKDELQNGLKIGNLELADTLHEESHSDRESGSGQASGDGSGDDPERPPTPSSTNSYEPDRRYLNQDEFDEEYDAIERPHKSVRDFVSYFCNGCECSGHSIKKKMCALFPILQLPKYYKVPGDLISDLIAGLTVGIMHVPQGMAYASLAGLPVEYGLYTSLFPVIIYAFLGTSRHVSPGTYGLVSLMMGGVVEGYGCDAIVLGTSVESLSDENSNSGGIWGNASSSSSEEGYFSSSSSSSSESMSRETYNEEIIQCKVEVAVAVTLTGGLFQLLLGVLRLGFITNFLSEPLARGFTTGAAVHVFTSQVKKLSGVPLDRHYGPFKLIRTYLEFFRKIYLVNSTTLIVSVVCIITIFFVKEVVNPRIKKCTRNKGFIPIDFVLIILGTVISVLMKFEENFDMWVVGDIPHGIPAPQAPQVDVMAGVFMDGIALAFVSYASSMSLTQLFAKKHNYEVDSNQELVAHGVTNVICSNLNCFMMGTSLSRSAVCENVGCKSQITGMVSSGLLLVVVIFIASYFEQLPRCVLAAIIVVALKGMFMQFADLKRYWRVNKIDFSVWLITFMAVVLLDAALGLIVGVVYALLTIIATTQRPYSTLEGRIENTEIYKDSKMYSKAKQIPGVKIFRFDGSIYFASKQYFMDCVYEKTECDPKRVRVQETKLRRKSKVAWTKTEIISMSQLGSSDNQTIEKVHIDMESGNITYGPTIRPQMHHLIIDATTIGYLDDSGVQSIKQICSEYKDIGVTVFLAGCKGGVRAMLEKGGFHDTFKKDILFPTVHDAVMAARKEGPKKPEDVEIMMQC